MEKSFFIDAEHRSQLGVVRLTPFSEKRAAFGDPSDFLLSCYRVISRKTKEQCEWFRPTGLAVKRPPRLPWLPASRSLEVELPSGSLLHCGPVCLRPDPVLRRCCRATQPKG